ncbi:MAG: PAS domain S-box protein [Acidimicrobiia bacterium]|nr:PAS domain S-box protein [Acidimicrobiia bacterium]
MGDSALAQLLRDFADAVVICDATGAIVFWNDAATTLFGWPAGEVIGRSLDVIIPERQRDRHWRGYERVMESGHTDYGDRLLEVPALHRDGRRLSIAFTVSLLTTPGQTAPNGIAAVIRDDTERWQERRDLRARLAALAAASDGGA